MSKGTLTTAQAERSAHHIMRNKLNIRNVQLIFSVIMFLTFAGLTGCRDKDSEFLEKELEQEENSQDSSEQESRQQPKADSQKNSGTQTESDSQKSSGTQSESGDVPETIYVDVCGAVAEPGVYELSSDSRVFQAIEKAGGYLPEAAVSYLNRARSLSDGQQIYVPTREEVDSQTIPPTQDGTTQTGTIADNNVNGTGSTDSTKIGKASGDNQQPTSDSAGGSADSRINLNTADVSQLTTLTGVGESKALAIIAYREENGPFTSVEDIMNVPGIKEGTYEKIKDKIAIE